MRGSIKLSLDLAPLPPDPAEPAAEPASGATSRLLPLLPPAPSATWALLSSPSGTASAVPAPPPLRRRFRPRRLRATVTLRAHHAAPALFLAAPFGASAR